MNWESQLTALLSASLLRPFVLAFAAALVLRVLQVRHPSSRHAVWSAVLLAMLLLPIASVIAPHWSLPVLPSKAQASAPAPAVIAAPEPEQAVELPIAPQTLSGTATLSLKTVMIWLYLAGLFAMLLYRAVGWILLRRVVARSTFLRRRLSESSDVTAPVTIGVLRPMVILPAGWRDWDAATRRAVLAHELAHIRRGDTLISALGRFVKCVLWFHPLAWWVSRKVAELAELACDVVALESVGDPGGYSRILLAFASGVNRAGYRVALPGLAMASSSSGMRQRIDQTFELADGRLRKLTRPGALLALTGLPVMCFAATVGLGESTAPLSRLRLPAITPPKPPELRVIAQQIQAQAQAPQPRTVPAQPAPASPQFEVAAIKSGTPVQGQRGCTGGPGTSDPSRWTCTNVNHYILIGNAYPLKSYQFTLPFPDWMMTSVFQIEARVPEGVTKEQMPLLIQNLLDERFKLAVHWEKKEGQVYEMTVGAGGPKFKEWVDLTDANTGQPPTTAPRKASDMHPAPDTPAKFSFPDGHVLFRGKRSAKELAGYLADNLGGPVNDETGLTGSYDIMLDYVGRSPRRDPPPDAPPPVPGPTLLKAVESQLGLKLESKKGLIDVLVIDHMEKNPTEN